ncbi:hypothetical protein PRIPAC_86755 [Pristionchus pacificus]|uniref:Uncharacterized protein n=1 Tax=Pristionchus pacificus TaxID=54126 RepID=A0A2A6BIA5_PRIPA|nr:hypothetical protein PRIPAC_86755 [Pristionchus pacificus]|eukprot:PDM65617.1 hypothetical protein PRIPAC_53625 [Pristionchus pacificus]
MMRIAQSPLLSESLPREARAHRWGDWEKEENAAQFSPNKADEWAVDEVNEAVDVAPASRAIFPRT